jgi:energy-coupling factor transport system permease protein
MTYRRRATPLHAARAAAGCAYCLALGLAALMLDNPIALGAILISLLAAGALAQVSRELGRALKFALPLALLIVLINALVTRDGLTVILRLGDLPVLGHTDVTFEATAYGAVLAARAVALILCATLYTTAIDPDEVLRLFRRISFRSALTATLATRMVPVLARDARRLADAQRCRPGRPPSRFTLVRAASSGVLDRALDVAAVLEVRGYGGARRPPRRPRPYSRHDVSFMLAAVAIVALAVVGRAGGLATFHAYPSIHASAGAGTLVVAGGIVLAALLPFADRRGVKR